MTKNNNTLSWRVTELEKGFDRLDCRLDDLMENDLPHMAIQIQSIKTRVSVLSAINIGAILIAILLNKFL